MLVGRSRRGLLLSRGLHLNKCMRRDVVPIRTINIMQWMVSDSLSPVEVESRFETSFQSSSK